MISFLLWLNASSDLKSLRVLEMRLTCIFVHIWYFIMFSVVDQILTIFFLNNFSTTRRTRSATSATNRRWASSTLHRRSARRWHRTRSSSSRSRRAQNTPLLIQLCCTTMIGAITRVRYFSPSDKRDQVLNDHNECIQIQSLDPYPRQAMVPVGSWRWAKLQRYSARLPMCLFVAGHPKLLSLIQQQQSCRAV